VLVSTYDDYYSSGSYFKDADGYPFWQAVYMPFGEVYKDFGSAGFVIGNPAGDGILWSVPFRFPGQYQDPEDELYNNIYYNRHRWYMPGLGRYNRADPFFDNLISSVHPTYRLNNLTSILRTSYSITNNYSYANNNSLYFVDYMGYLACTPPKETDPCKRIEDLLEDLKKVPRHFKPTICFVLKYNCQSTCSFYLSSNKSECQAYNKPCRQDCSTSFNDCKKRNKTFEMPELAMKVCTGDLPPCCNE